MDKHKKYPTQKLAIISGISCILEIIIVFLLN